MIKYLKCFSKRECDKIVKVAQRKFEVKFLPSASSEDSSVSAAAVVVKTAKYSESWMLCQTTSVTESHLDTNSSKQNSNVRFRSVVAVTEALLLEIIVRECVVIKAVVL